MRKKYPPAPSQVSNHICVLQDYIRSEHVPNIRKEDVVYKIVSLSALAGYAMHEALCRLLKDLSSSMQKDESTMDFVLKSIGSWLLTSYAT